MAATSETADRVYVSAEAAEAFTRQLMLAHGLPEQDAAIVAHCLVSADLRGVDTHGIARLPGYLDRVRRGLINAKPNLKPERVTPVAATLDGQDAFGFVVGMCAINEAMAMAREFGIGVVSARRSTHFGMAASYALPAIEAGFMAMVFSNASPAMPPWGGKDGLLGTNPFCVGAPGGKHRAVPARHVARGRRARQDPARRAARRDDPARLCARQGRPRRPPIRRRRSAAWCCRSAATRAPASR